MKVINMIPYGTRLGFHEDGVASTVARIDYKFPQCVCYENSEGGGVLAMMEREISMMVTENKANTLTSTDYKGAQVICHERFLYDRESSGRQQGTD